MMNYLKNSLNIVKISSLFLIQYIVLFSIITEQALAETRLSAPPVPTIISQLNSNEQALTIQSVHFNSRIVGNFAKSDIELTVYNPNKRDLEAQLEFPLLGHQQVTGFALDINGKMRSASAIEKAQGAQVFEDVTRQNIDPALLSRSQGNSYKLRIFPIPPNGTRTVKLTISQTLSKENQQYLFHLALGFTQNITALKGKILIKQTNKKAIQSWLGAHTLNIEQQGADAIVSIAKKDVKNLGLLNLSIAAQNNTQVAIEDFKGQHYFYAQLPTNKLPIQTRALAQKINLIWDMSNSGNQRDVNAEIALLAQYFANIKRAEVTLIPLRNSTEKNQKFTIIDGNWQQLKQYLHSSIYDGAAQPSVLNIPQNADINLLFSDGVYQYGDSTFPTISGPLYAVNSAVGGNTPLLQQLAQSKGGRYIDLLTQSKTAALTQLQTIYPFVEEVVGENISDVLVLNRFLDDDSITIVGKLNRPTSPVNIRIRKVDGSVETLKYTLTNKEQSSADMTAQLWATQKLIELEQQPILNQQAIVRLAKEFSLISEMTSLLVLERIEDYIRYEVEPPAELKAQYDELMSKQQKQKQRSEHQQIEKVAGDFELKKTWWNKDFPINPPKKIIKKNQPVPQASPSHHNIDFEEAVAQEAIVDTLLPQTRSSGNVTLYGNISAGVASDFSQQSQVKSKSLLVNKTVNQASIQLKKWMPNANYLKRLKAAKAEDYYAIYLDEKPDYLNSTAFFLDVADFMYDHNQAVLAARILSNLATMKLENREILRILGYRLLHVKEYALAIDVFKKVKILSPYEPQSYRDLALALHKNGQDQAAIDELWTVIKTPWDSRFSKIELIALDEMNAIIATSKQKLTVQQIDKRFLFAMPLDLRVVLSWDTDNTDIDLWVIDPDGEKVFYGNKLSRIGGLVSEDMTRGYGPETYSLKTAKAGVYKVQAQFYGHNQQILSPSTNLMLKLSTKFASKQQKDQESILRLSGQGEMVDVGIFTIK